MGTRTPGPWVAWVNKLGWWVTMGGGYAVFRDVPENEVAANARLIAAAPTMMAALRKIVAMVETVEDRMDPDEMSMEFEEFLWKVKSMADDAIPQGIGEPERPTP